jgi:hypothetical protein
LKKHFILFLLAFFAFTGGCGIIKKDDIPIEMNAFNHLSDREQQRIPVSPKDSIVTEIIVNEDLSESIGGEFLHKKLYAVTFNHSETDTAGDLIVYVALDKKTVVGKGNEQKE